MARAGAIRECSLTVGVADECQWLEADGELLDHLRAGEREAFEWLVRKYQTSVYGLLVRVIGSREDARDATQETFLKVYCNIKRFRGDCELKTWIYRIALNQAANYQRWWRRRGGDRTVSIDYHENDEEPPLSDTLADEHADPERVAIVSEERRRLLQALESLKPDFRAALVLRDVEGLAYEEIAQALEISLGTVKSRIARAREMVRQAMMELSRGR
jgi:RNA polymerase sigma-70 factor (ECF subfamily)